MVWPESGFWGVICEERQMDVGCAAQQSVGCMCWWSVWVTGRRGHGPKMFWVLEGLGKQAKATTACHMWHYEVSREESGKGEWLGHVGGSWKDTERTWRSSVIRGNLMQCLEQGGDRCGRTEETLGWRISRPWNLQDLRAFRRGMEVKNLGFMLHSVDSHGAFMSLGTMRKDPI